jgi:hypothetical protein
MRSINQALLDNSLAPAANSTYTRLHRFWSRNKDVLIPTAAESAIALTCASITTHFTEPAMYYVPLGSSSLMLLLNYLNRNFKCDDTFGRGKQQYSFSDISFSNCHDIFLEYLAYLPLITRTFLFTIADYINRTVLWHETGHLLMVLCLFQNAHPEMTLEAFEGATQPNFDGDPILSDLGNYFGLEKSYGIVAAMGTGFEILWVCGSLIAAQAIREDHQELKYYLRGTTLLPFLASAQYPILAIGTCDLPSNKGNDFCVLEKAGVDPAIAASIIVGAVLLTQFILSGCTRLKKRCAVSKLFLPAAEIKKDQAQSDESHINIRDTFPISPTLK